ncbi:hypothetical protein ACA910_019120 [Epithemia clementina (nom. ined.)]
MSEEDFNHDEDDVEEELASEEASPSRGKGAKKRRDTLRKAPQAPKRFKSSYICFFMAKQPEIKDSLGDKATVTEISKRSAEMWKGLASEDRAYWDEVARKDKERYMVEKASYTGPWQVPWKRAKKDPSAPKRPMSAFLYFSQGKRTLLKKQHPDMKNTEVSRLLGEMWRNAPDSEKRPHIEKEKEEREKYKIAIAEWRKDAEARQEAQKQAAAEWTAAEQQATTSAAASSMEQAAAMPPSGHHFPRDHGYAHHQSPLPPAQYMYQPPPFPYPYSTGLYTFPPPPPVNGKQQPVILGPNGVPHHYAPMPYLSYPMDPSQNYPHDEGLVGPDPHLPFDCTDTVETTE